MILLSIKGHCCGLRGMDQKETLRQLTEKGGFERLIGELIVSVKLTDKDVAGHWQKIEREIGSIDSASRKAE